MHDLLIAAGWLSSLTGGFLKYWGEVWPYLLIFLGFSAVIFVHELGHFLAAKWAGVRVERFAIGFFSEVFGFTRGETRYSFNILPLGGYVKMLGQEDFDEKTMELKVKDDPRAYSNKPVFHRMVIVSAGVLMNILFALLLFVVVFTTGMQENVPIVGHVLPESPAAFAGLRSGDTIRKLNGKDIRVYAEIKFGILLADPHTALDFEVLRGDQVLNIPVRPEPEQQKNLLRVGIGPATTHVVGEIADSAFDRKNPEHLRPGDRIVAIEGEPLEANSLRGGLENRMRSPDGRPLTVTVERVPPGQPEAAASRTDVSVFNQLVIDPAEPLKDLDTRNILGLIPLVRVNRPDEKGRAELAGFKEGDTIIQWGPHAYPTQKQITESIVNAKRRPPADRQPWRRRLYDRFAWDPEVETPVKVIRRDREKPVAHALTLTPKVVSLDAPPLAGFAVNGIASHTLRISGVLEKVNGRPTPAFEAGIPKGALILSVAGSAVNTWPELIEQFRRAAGTTVPVSYRTLERQEVTCEFRVPQCVHTQLGLSTLGSIVSVDNQSSVNVDTASRRVTLSAGYSYGLYQLLKDTLERSGGQSTTVSIRYQERPDAPEREAQVEITPESIDPWLGRVKYAANVYMELRFQLLRATGPLDAVAIGVEKTWYFVLQVYTMMQRMIVSRSVGVEHVSGPVGIVKVGSDAARSGFVGLVFFLAVISANLAVINFLPLPIVDGGLMVFLIIEKIKGSPVSLKVQVATQLIGLFLIASAFLFVTFQDVIRLAG